MIESKTKYILLMIVSVASSLQFDYFFGNYFIVPFLSVLLATFFVFFYYSFSLLRVIVLFLFCCLLLAVSFLDFFQDFLSLRRLFLYYIFIFFAFFTIGELLEGLDQKRILNIAFYICFFSTISLVVEAYFRFNYPTLDLNGDSLSYINSVISFRPSFYDLVSNNDYYVYKYSSVMFYDSNYVALFSLFVVVLLLFYRRHASNNWIVYFLLFLNAFLIVFTFSRSGIIVLTVVLFLELMRAAYNKGKQFFFLCCIIFILLLIFTALFTMPLLMKDGSFVTKIEIFESLLDFGSKDILNMLFGFGVEYGSYVYSYKEGAFAHAMIPLLLGQVGLFGLALYISTYFYFCIKSGFYGALIFVVMFLSGFSLVDLFQVLNIFSLLIVYFYNKNAHDFSVAS